MFAFSMVVITAFIGTIDLGQAVFKALSESDLGKGLTLGLCISFLALSVDHLIKYWARERRRLLGLD
jgi:glycine betaine/proline transport system permease protein